MGKLVTYKKRIDFDRKMIRSMVTLNFQVCEAMAFYMISVWKSFKYKTMYVKIFGSFTP